MPKLARGELLEGVLREVADKKAPTNTTSTGSRAPRYELKPELACEYDPEFYHLSAQPHKAAADRVAHIQSQPSPQKSEEPLSPLCMVAPPPIAHPSFACVRHLLVAPPLRALVRSIRARAVLLSTPSSTSAAGSSSSPAAAPPPLDLCLLDAAALSKLRPKRSRSQMHAAAIEAARRPDQFVQSIRRIQVVEPGGIQVVERPTDNSSPPPAAAAAAPAPSSEMPRRPSRWDQGPPVPTLDQAKEAATAEHS